VFSSWRTGPFDASIEMDGSPLLPPFYRSVVVARNAFRLRDPLIFDGRFENRAGFHLPDDGPLDFLPGRLVLGIVIAALDLQLTPTLGQFLVRDENVRLAATDIDAYPVACPDEGKPAAGRSFRGSVEDRGAAGRARLAPVADAGKRGDTLLQQV